jgi:hypothetical protein
MINGANQANRQLVFGRRITSMMRKSSVLIATAVAVIALFGREASAQVPGLTATATGRSVTINITPVAGATGHRLAVGTAPGSANIASVNLPLSVTRIVVDAPDGSYFMRVAAMLGTLVGPFGADVRVDVASAPPPGPCTPPTAPAVTASSSGLSVSLSWTAVAGAIGYRIHWSRTAGGTELVESTTATSLNKFVGTVGTFFARVEAVTPCGNATSLEVTFTLANTPGAGPRTPNPPPGVLLPIPAYAAGVVQDVARRYPAELARACKTNHDFLFILLRELRKYDTRWGLNWKRGDVRQGMSSDIVAFNPNDQPDEGNGKVYIFDVIGAECEGNYPTFGDSTPVTWASAGHPACGAGTFCTKWTLEPYLLAGFPADKQQ